MVLFAPYDPWFNTNTPVVTFGGTGGGAGVLFFEQENKKVIVKICLHNKQVRISVTDFGIGLSEDQKERIFERFYRVEDKKHMTSGLGMGLYISAEIIANHKGEIGVESTLGKGSTFYVDLPLLEVKQINSISHLHS